MRKEALGPLDILFSKPVKNHIFKRLQNLAWKKKTNLKFWIRVYHYRWHPLFFPARSAERIFT